MTRDALELGISLQDRIEELKHQLEKLKHYELQSAQMIITTIGTNSKEFIIDEALKYSIVNLIEHFIKDELNRLKNQFKNL